jgi:hypothetical protein
MRRASGILNGIIIGKARSVCIAHPIHIPFCPIQQVLNTIRSGCSYFFSYLPPVFPFYRTEESSQLASRPVTGLLTKKIALHSLSKFFKHECSTPLQEMKYTWIKNAFLDTVDDALSCNRSKAERGEQGRGWPSPFPCSSSE